MAAKTLREIADDVRMYADKACGVITSILDSPVGTILKFIPGVSGVLPEVEGIVKGLDLAIDDLDNAVDAAIPSANPQGPLSAVAGTVTLTPADTANLSAVKAVLTAPASKSAVNVHSAALKLLGATAAVTPRVADALAAKSSPHALSEISKIETFLGKIL